MDTREARQLLAELELISHGSTQSWNSSGRGESSAAFPPGESAPPHLHWRARFTVAHPEALPALIEAARTDLKALRTRSNQAPASISVDLLVIEDGTGYSPEHVAHSYGLTPAHIRRIRERAGRSIETGQAPDDRCTLDPIERAQRVRDLAAKGMTQKQIAMAVGCNQATVSRDLKRAA